MLEWIAGAAAGIVVVFLFVWVCSMVVIGVLKVAGRFGKDEEA